MAYNIYYVLFMGLAFWVHLIGICGGLSQEHFCEIRGVLATVLWLDPNIHLDYWSSACGHQKVFRLRMPYTKHYFGPQAINFGNW